MQETPSLSLISSACMIGCAVGLECRVTDLAQTEVCMQPAPGGWTRTALGGSELSTGGRPANVTHPNLFKKLIHQKNPKSSRL